jgi:hypothetical protein
MSLVKNIRKFGSALVALFDDGTSSTLATISGMIPFNADMAAWNNPGSSAIQADRGSFYVRMGPLMYLQVKNAVNNQGSNATAQMKLKIPGGFTADVRGYSSSATMQVGSLTESDAGLQEHKPVISSTDPANIYFCRPSSGFSIAQFQTFGSLNTSGNLEIYVLALFPIKEWS